MSLEMIKKYWWVFPLLGVLAWVGLYLYARAEVSKTMESVRQAKADKAAGKVSDIMNGQAEDAKTEANI